MSEYIVSARKYRPSSFASVVGQSALTTTLQNAIVTGKLAHAYLFCGPRGVGKTTSARIFAKTINCLQPNSHHEACGECESCRAFDQQRSYNIHELDAASNNSVDDIRELIEQVQIPPQIGRYKVFIIDEVHMLSQAAFNAFLKTLEEPPAHAIFILATTEKHKILPTILSRCQIYDFNRMEVNDIVNHLKHVAQNENISYEEEALAVIARKADGGMRDSLSIFDQVASYCNGNITYAQTIENLNVLDYDYYFEITDQLLQKDIPQSLLTLGKILSKGFEGNHFMGGLAAHLRDVLMSKDPQTLPLLEVPESVRERYAQQAQRCTPIFLYAALKLCNDCDLNYRAARNKRLLVELTLIQVAQLLEQDENPGSGLGPKQHLQPIFQPEKATTNSSPVRQVAQQPTIQPTVSTIPPPTPNDASPKMGKLNVLRTLSIKQSPSATKSEAARPQQPVSSSPIQQFQRTPFTLEQLRYQWMLFANCLPREASAQASRLKVICTEANKLQMLPASDNEPQTIVGKVDNETAAQHLEEIVPQLTQHLRTNLKNDFIALQWQVDNSEQIAQVAFTPREVFHAMLEKSEELRQLSEKLKLQLA